MGDYKEPKAAIAPQAVRSQLGKILVSEGFARSRRMQRFLEFVVEEALAGRAEQLGEYTVGLAVFDRGPGFEPALDPIVRNDARRLRLKLLEFYRHPSRAADNIRIEMPKGGYTPVFLPMSPRDDGGLPLPDPSRRLAVLPFEILSPASEGARYGRALCLSLTAHLTNLDGLEAVAHGYLREQPLRETASELRLSHVIHGSVWRSSDRCHVIINLIHVSKGTQLWAREYDFEVGELPLAQSKIAAQVRREVAARLGLPCSQLHNLALAA